MLKITSLSPKISIFVKMFIPIIFIMLMQAGIINTFLFASGTIDALNNNSIDILSKNAQNRSLHLEHLMVHYWSNIDSLESDVIEGIGEYLDEHNLSVADVLGNRELEIDLLSDMSGKLIEALRVTASTGVFMYILSGEGLAEETQHLNGLYYRDLSLLTNIHANLIFVRGHVNIARADNIPLDSFWNELFTFDPQHEDLWRGFSYPQIAAQQFPGASSADLSYWNRPHYLNPDLLVDSNPKITYTRPVFFDGQLVAMIGTEMQMSHVERHFPARDLDNFSESGYILIRYYINQARQEGIVADVFRVTGAFMNRLFGGKRQITLDETRRDGVYTIAELPEVHVVHYSLHLYNPGSPFSSDRWVLAAMSTERAMFEMTRTVNSVVLYSSAFACLAGGVFLFFTIKSFTNPIDSIIKQLKMGDGNTIIQHKSNTFEIDLLCYTINDMTERRLSAERQIREEHQRYLLALESSDDTFVEYDIASDVLLTYYFKESSQPQQTPEYKTMRNFNKAVLQGEIFHPDDDFDFFAIRNHEVRIHANAFPHVKSSASDNGYHWFSIKTIVINDDKGNPAKIIGSAREITQEKVNEFAAIENSRRDLTTGFFNLAYGLERAQKSLFSAQSAGHPFALSLVRIVNFDRLELTYGLMFGGIFMAEFSHALSRILDGQDFAVRLSNDEFLIYYDLPEADARTKDSLIHELLDTLYAGEETDFELSLRIDAVDNISKLARAKNENPINISLDLNAKENIGTLALELFERTSHIGSSVMVLIGLIGRMFALDNIIICSYNAEFGINKIVHQWHTKDNLAYNQDSIKLSPESVDSFTSKLKGSDNIVYRCEKAADDPVNTALCINPGDSTSVYCCVIHEHAVNVGSMLFISKDAARIWPESDKNILHNIAKIISTYMNVEKTRSASRAKSLFLSRISHEIRTPMNAIIGMTNIAKDSAETNNRKRLDDCLEKIDVSANYLLSLLNDVLEMSRIESGKLLRIENKPFSLRHFVQGIEAIIRFAIESNGIKLDIIHNYKHDKIISDEYRLKQVIINLLGNANKFTKPGGNIVFLIEELVESTIETPDLEESDSSRARFMFSVKDNGIGISFNKQADIFKPFEQADAPSLNNQQGTGLGLSISRNIITAMGSSIELVSEPEKGSEFSFILDLQLHKADEELSEPSQPYESAYSDDHFKGNRVLIVDDVEINIEIATFVLEDVGFEVETAVNGKDALDKFFNAPSEYYDVILMDIQMPVMDGITATKAIRMRHKRPDAQTIPIIALTANAFDEDLKTYIESGMDDHITKPFDIEKLLDLLNRVVKLK